MSESKIWFCKIGEVDGASVPDGGDLPMRMAVKEAYFKLTGQRAKFIFSGWGATLDEGERAVVEKREPSPEHYAAWLKREAAPELYEALKPVADPVREVSRDDRAVATVHVELFVHELEAIRAALIKATPEQSDV